MARQRSEGSGTALEEPEAQPQEPRETRATATALLDHLKATGTPAGKCKAFEFWARQNPEASAEDLYRHLEADSPMRLDGRTLHPSGGQPTALGTLRKAGKFVFGPEFEPEKAVKLAPAEELLRLRQENDQLQATLSTLRAERLGLFNQNTHLQERVNDLLRQVSFLKIGKSQADLEAAGVK